MVFIYISQISKKIGLLAPDLPISACTEHPDHVGLCWVYAMLRAAVGRADIVLYKIYGFFIILYSFSLLPLPLTQKNTPQNQTSKPLKQHKPNNNAKGRKKAAMHLRRKTLSLGNVETPSSLYLLSSLRQENMWKCLKLPLTNI